MDRYNVPVTAIAILADSNQGYRPTAYLQEFMGTRLSYKFNSYKILDQDETLLRADPNPFSVVVLTALLAIIHRHVTDDELKNIKHDLYEEMMQRRMDKKVRQGIYDFLAYYVNFKNQEMFGILEQEVERKQGRSVTVGTREYLLDKAKTEGKLEEAKAIAREMKQDGIPAVQIAKFTKLTIAEIEK